MLIMFFYIVINTSRYFGFDLTYHYLSFLHLPVLLAIIPTYCLHLRALKKTSSRTRSISKSTLLCFLPSITILFLNIIAVITFGGTSQSPLFVTEKNPQLFTPNALSLFHVTFILGNLLFVLFQAIIASFQFQKHLHWLSATTKSKPSTLPHFNVSWSYFVFMGVISFVIINSLMNFYTPAYNTTIALVFNLLILFSGSAVGYFSLKQDHFSNKTTVNQERVKTAQNNSDTTDITGVEKASSSNETEENSSTQIMTNLIELFNTEKPYLNSNLSLIDVSRKLGISKQKLTYVLNYKMNSSFYHFVNKYRVEESKKMLRQKEHFKYNLKTISDMSGFRSKSTFNACFKKFTHMTPSEYRNKVELKKTSKEELV